MNVWETFKKELADFVDCERVETAIRVENENAEKERKKRTFIKCLLDQIEEREETRLTEATNVFFEKMLFNEALTQMEVEEFEKYQKHLKKQADTKAKTEEINAANKALKIIEQQRNKLEELRIIEHVKEADERATEHDRKLKEIREKREKIKEGLYEKLLRDKPNCEYKNESKLTSPWVKEEKDGLIKKIEDIKHFRAGVDKQLQEKAICQANELQRDREDHLKTIKVRDEIMQKELELERLRLKERDAWRTALLHQINEAEKAKIEARKKVCTEKEEMETNIGLWEEIISERIKEKLDEARSNQVSEIYLKNIEREMQID
ncbi:hypothetical protein AAG570_007713 [Ranatra chinensis]|uniref:Cilia- and flagella-associated protein 45 n=1 Tax=Ranatra chinensis TaxID=642074 RepID=A0ABD0YCW0_9HEMI